MRVLHRLADLDEQLEALADRQLVLVAVLGDRLALHQLHHEVRPPAPRRAGVEHARDVRMIHQRQRLALGLEAGDDLPRVHAELDDLERDAPPHRPRLLGHEHGAEAAFADLLEQAVGTDLRPGHVDRLRRTGLTKLGAVCGVGHGGDSMLP